MEASKTAPSASGNSSSTQRTRVQRNHLLVEKMNLSHATSIIGPGRTQDQIVSMLQTLESQKKDLNAFTRMELKKRMVERARITKMQYHDKPVRSFEDILKSWAYDDTMANAAKVFDVMYGDYDEHPDWLCDLEKRFMDKMNWDYYSPDNEPCDKGETFDGTRKGCVQLLMTRVRIQLLKAINRASFKTHGKIIRISRYATDINDKNRYKKRDKGTFDERFVHETHAVDGEVNTDVDESMEIEELREELGDERRKHAACNRQLVKSRKSGESN